MAAGMTFAEAIDVIEETYEFMLAYAAQGRRSEDEEDAGSGIRDRLTRAEAALGVIASATVEAIATGAQAAQPSAWCWRSARSGRRSLIISTPPPMCARC
jgi:hypothetical protein